MDGFKFGGKHSLDDMEVYTVLKQKPLFAEPKTTLEELPATDGESDYSRVNPRRRLFFKPRIIEYECHFVGEDEDEESFNRKAREIAAWLAGAGESRLEPDDEPDIYYMAKCLNLYNIDAVTPYSGCFPLVFRCEPYRYARRETVVVQEEAADGDSVVVNNPGYYTAPVITVSGVAPSGFTLACNGASLNVGQALDGASVVVDMNRMEITKDGLSVTHTADGSFFELPSGRSEVTVSGTGLAVSVSIQFRAQYL